MINICSLIPKYKSQPSYRYKFVLMYIVKYKGSYDFCSLGAKNQNFGWCFSNSDDSLQSHPREYNLPRQCQKCSLRP